MKLRTGLVAATTAIAVTASGAAVATAAPVAKEKPGATTTNTTTTGTEGSSIKDIDPNEIQDWVAVVSAIIAMLVQLATLVNKFVR